MDGLTDTLTAVGTYQTSDYQTKSWIFDPAKGFRLYTEPGKALYAQDMNAGGRVVGTYQDSTGKWHGFTKRGKDFRRLSLPNADVGGCKVNDLATIMCGYHKANGETGGLLAGDLHPEAAATPAERRAFRLLAEVDESWRHGRVL